jgi:hypothetical protein
VLPDGYLVGTPALIASALCPLLKNLEMILYSMKLFFQFSDFVASPSPAKKKRDLAIKWRHVFRACLHSEKLDIKIVTKLKIRVQM